MVSPSPVTHIDHLQEGSIARIFEDISSYAMHPLVASWLLMANKIARLKTVLSPGEDMIEPPQDDELNNPAAATSSAISCRQGQRLRFFQPEEQLAASSSTPRVEETKRPS